MNIIDILKEDHDKIFSLVEEFQRNDNLKDSREIFENLYESLLIHSECEEQILYPTLQRVLEIEEFVEDHEAVMTMMDKIDFKQQNLIVIKQQLTKLNDLLKEHINQEENKVFPLLKENCTEADLNEMEKNILQIKEELKKGISVAF
jgi:hemerythrin-like domain-containing protein